MKISNINKGILGAMMFALALTSCVEYEAEPFSGKTLPRKTGYSTGVTNDWMYFNLENGVRFNVLNPNQSVLTSVNGKSISDPANDGVVINGETLKSGEDKTIYWYEGAQKDDRLTFKDDKYTTGSDIYHKATEWDIAFCGYRMRTNSGTSGIGQGGAADLGYGEYDKWTSKAQVDAYMQEHGLKFEVDDSASVYVTMSQNDWNKYCIKNHLDFNKNPWFDPNNGPAKQVVSANPVLANAMSFSGPPPVYTPSYHTYVIRSWDGKRYYKLNLISWYDANVEIGDEGGCMSYYMEELK